METSGWAGWAQLSSSTSTASTSRSPAMMASTTSSWASPAGSTASLKSPKNWPVCPTAIADSAPDGHRCEGMRQSGGGFGVHLPDEDLGRLQRGDLLAAGGREAHGVAGVQGAGTFQVDGAAGDEEVQVRRLRQLDALVDPEPGGVERGVAVLDPDGRPAVVLGHPGGHGYEPAPQQLVFDLQLLVARGDAALVGHDPHLHEVDGLVVAVAAGEPPGVVLLRVEDAGAGAHPLGQPGVDDAGVTGGVLMDERALQHPRHDL